jgi:lipid-binding SYLF domain-containing protein
VRGHVDHQGTGRRQRLSTHRGWFVYLAFTITLGLGALQGAQASDAAEAEALVTKARLALENFQRDPDMEPMRQLAKRAWAMFIMPHMLKGGFVVGGSGGNGVLLARQGPEQPWRGPAFYTVGGISFGLQAGAELSEVVMLAMTQRGMTAMLRSSVKLGAEANVALGPIGAGAEAATAGLSVDLLVFSRSKGLYGGFSLQGAVMSTRDTLNHAFYGRAVSTTDILVQGTALSDKADGLLMSVSQFSQAR